MDNKQLVVDAVTALFVQRDPKAIDKYVSPDYIQHSTAVGPGREALRELVSGLPEELSYDLARVLGEGDYVVLHGTYRGLWPDPMAAFDVFRVEDGRLAEHWDALQPEPAQTASGRSMTDGPREVTQPELSAQSKALVARLVDSVLVRGDAATLTDFIDESYAQHNPLVADGISGLQSAVAALTQQGLMFKYTKVHRLIADGEFVLVQSEGTFGPTPTAFYDLFRVEDGRAAEHWDVVFPIPETLPHDNGLF